MGSTAKLSLMDSALASSLVVPPAAQASAAQQKQAVRDYFERLRAEARREGHATHAPQKKGRGGRKAKSCEDDDGSSNKKAKKPTPKSTFPRNVVLPPTVAQRAGLAAGHFALGLAKLAGIKSNDSLTKKSLQELNDASVDAVRAPLEKSQSISSATRCSIAGAASQSGPAIMTVGASSAHAHAGPSSERTARSKKAKKEPPVQQAPASAGKIKKEVPLKRTPPPNKTAMVGPWTGKKYAWELPAHLISWVRAIDILRVQYAILNEDDDTWKDAQRDALLYRCEAHKAWAYARACRRCRQKRVLCLAVEDSRTCAKCVGMGKSCGAGGGCE